MKAQTKKHAYVPSRYEIVSDFDFDLHLSIGDYLFLVCYAVLLGPFLLATRLAKMLTGNSSGEPKKVLPRYADGRIYLFISNLF